MYKVLIVEPNEFHEEVVLPQLYLLENQENFEYHVFIHEKLTKRGIDFNFNNISIVRSSNKIAKIFSIFEITKYIIDNKIDLVVFNTLECHYIRILNKLIPSRVKRIGIIHNADTIDSNKMNLTNFLLLSNNVLENFEKQHTGFLCDAFYPLLYPKRMYCADKNSDVLNICIPGKVELIRRDYYGLLELLKKNNPDRIKFTILGNINAVDGPSIRKAITESGLENSFKLFDGFISYDEYFRILNTTDIIMPLVHPDVPNFTKYHSTKITASFNMAFTFIKPLLMFESFINIKEFEGFAFYYNFDNFSDIINGLTRERIDGLKNNILNEKRFDIKYQSNRYAEFLNKVLNA